MRGMIRWTDVKSGRRVYVIEAKGVEDWPAAPEWAPARFGLLFAAEHIVDAKALASKAVEQGLALVCAWGSASPLIEEAFDEIIVRSVRGPETEHNVIWSTSHPSESLQEAIEFFLETAAPARDVKCEAWCIFAIGEPLARRVEKALARRGATKDSP